MNMEVILAAALIVVLLVFIVVMYAVYSGIKQCLRDNIEEVLIVSGEYVAEQIKAADRSVTDRMKLLQDENRTLREELTGRLDAITSIIRDSDGKAELGINNIIPALRDEMTKLLEALSKNAGTLTDRMNLLQNENRTLREELTGRLDAITSIIRDSDGKAELGINNIIPALRDEMTNLLQALSDNAVTLQESALKNFEDEVKKFIQVMNTSCENLDKATQKQNELFENVAVTVQSVLQTSARDIQSDFEETRTSLRTMITDSIKQIEDDYQKNMRAMFQAMADNLASIIQELRNANTGGN